MTLAATPGTWIDFTQPRAAGNLRLRGGWGAPARVLETGANAVHVDPALIPRARQPIDRMLAFTAALKNGQPTGALVPHLGAA